MLSLMADVSLCGVHSGAMHLHNAVLHALNAVFVFWLLLVLLLEGSGAWRKSAESDRSDRPDKSDPSDRSGAAVCVAAFGALLWALHPLRVESVAWVSSRKDVLCAFWYLLGTIVYLKHVARGANGLWVVPVTLLFYLLAIMSKPTALVFPATLFLSEYLMFRRIPWRRMAVFAGVTLYFAGVTFFAQKEAMLTERFALPVRLCNAAAAFSRYLAATVWPRNLSVFYPYQNPVPLAGVISGSVLLAGLLWFIMLPFLRAFLQDARESKGRMRQPVFPEGQTFLTLGALWFLVALLPVIGIIHVGEAAYADRYTYLSGIGLSILFAAGLSWCGNGWPRAAHRMLLLAAIGWLAALSFAAFRYIGVWRDSVTLFTHARQAVPENHVAECSLGAECFRQQDADGAINHYRLMVAQRGCDHASVVLLEYILWKSVKDENPDIKTPQAILLLNVRPDDPVAAVKNFSLACIAYDRKLYLAAESSVLESLRLNPDDGYAREVYARILLAQERYGEALEQALAAQTLLPKRAAIKRLLKQLQWFCAQEPERLKGRAG